MSGLNPDGLGVNRTYGNVESDSVNTESVNSNYHYTGGFNEATPEERLTAALSTASTGDTVYLEPVEYSNDRTFQDRLSIVGTGAGGAGLMGRFTGDIQVNNRISFNFVEFFGGSVTVNAEICQITNSLLDPGHPVDVNNDSFRYLNNFGGTVTFASGTSNGIVDGCTLSSVTDNGSNTVGDIA